IGILLAALEQDLETEAHAEHPTARSGELDDDTVEAAVAEAAHARAECADAGDDERVSARGDAGIAGDLRPGADALERALHRPEVPHSVVEDRDAHSTPFVDGASPRPVSAHASPSARASALNSASTTWWGARPDNRRTWS